MAHPDHRAGTVQSGDVTLSYRRFGAPGATPILFCHGANYFDSHDWIEVADALSDGRETGCFDWRGFGDSSWSPSMDYSMDAFCGDIRAIIDAFGWRRPILVGHSMAGRISMVFASRFADLISRVVIVDHAPGHTPPRSQGPKLDTPPLVFDTVEAAMAHFDNGEQKSRMAHDRGRAEAALRKTDDGWLVKRDPNFSNVVPQGDGAPTPELNDIDIWQELANIKLPIMIVRGTRSDRWKPETIQRIQGEFAHIRWVEVDSTHDVACHAPDALVAAIREFEGETAAAA